MKKFAIILPLLASFMLAGCSSEDSNMTVKDASDKAKDTVTSYVNENKDSWEEKAENLWNSITSDEDDETGTVITESSDMTEIASELANTNYESGTSVDVDVNGGISNLTFEDFEEPYIEYSNLDEYNRAGTAIAHIEKENYGSSKERSSQTWSPTGWNNQAKKVDGKKVYPQNRGHLIAYTISFNFDVNGNYNSDEDGSLDNPLNLVSQSSYSNQVTFQKYEELVRESIKAGHKVIYRVQPIYRDSELMPRGLWAQAISDDGSVNFNTYIYNVQPGISFDYSTGKSTLDDSIKVGE